MFKEGSCLVYGIGVDNGRLPLGAVAVPRVANILL